MSTAKYYLPHPRKEADGILISFKDKETGEVCTAKIVANIQQTDKMTLLTIPKSGKQIQFEFFTEKAAEEIVTHWKQKKGIE